MLGGFIIKDEESLMKNTDEKKNQKKTLGMPVEWDSKKPFKNLWNRNSDQILLPKGFGVGWTINFHAVLKKIGLIKKN